MSFLEDDIVEQDIEHHYGISPFRPPAIGEEKQPNARRVVDGHRGRTLQSVWRGCVSRHIMEK